MKPEHAATVLVLVLASSARADPALGGLACLSDRSTESASCGALLSPTRDIESVLPIVTPSDSILIAYTQDKEGKQLISLSQAGVTAASHVVINVAGGDVAFQITQPLDGKQLSVSLDIAEIRRAPSGSIISVSVDSLKDLTWWGRLNSVTKMNLCVAENPSKFPPPTDVMGLHAMEKVNWKVNSDFCDRMLVSSNLPDSDLTFAGKNDLLAARFAKDGDAITLREAGLATSNSVFINLENGDRIPLTLIEEELELEYLRINLNRKAFADTQHGARITVEIHRKGSTDKFAFRWSRRFELYGVADKSFGLWLPVGLFSTNFQLTRTGVAFAAMPIGLGFGGKLNVYDKLYIGISFVASWLIHDEVDTMGKSTGNVSLAAITLGGLVDIANFVYVGYAYGLDFIKQYVGAPNPGHMFVIGAAPGIIQFLKARL